MKSVGQNLYLRGDRYYAIIERNGRQIWKSLRTASREVAERKLLAHRNRLQKAPASGRLDDIPTIGVVCGMVGLRLEKHGRKNGVLYQPRALKAVKAHLKLILESPLGGLKISKATETHVRDYLDKVAEKASGRTANRRRTEFRKVFQYGIQKGWCWDNPVDKVELYGHIEKETHVPSPEDLRKVLNVLRDTSIVAGSWNEKRHEQHALAADFIEVIANSGLRHDEAARLHKDRILFDKNLLTVRRKGGQEASLDLFPGLKRVLEQIKAKDRDFGGFLFPQNKSYPYAPRKTLNYACQEAGVRRFDFKALRHFFASLAVDQGVDFAVVGAWLNHKDGGILASKRYGKHRRPKHLAMLAGNLHLDF